MSWFEIGHVTNALKRSTKFGEIPPKINEIDWKLKKVNEFNSWFESLCRWLDSKQYSRDLFFSHESIWIKTLDLFWVVSWFESKYSGSFLSHESIWIKFQKSILRRELIWIKACKVNVNHELSRSKLCETKLNRIKKSQLQKSILSRELIWIKCCKIIVNHDWSRVKTLWD